MLYIAVPRLADELPFYLPGPQLADADLPHGAGRSLPTTSESTSSSPQTRSSGAASRGGRPGVFWEHLHQEKIDEKIDAVPAALAVFAALR